MGTIKSSRGKLSAHTNLAPIWGGEVESNEAIEDMVKEVCNNYKLLQAINLPDVDNVNPDNVADICNIAGAHAEALAKVLYGLCNIAAEGDQGKRLASAMFVLTKNYI